MMCILPDIEQWFKRHSEAGSPWLSWPRVSHSPLLQMVENSPDGRWLAIYCSATRLVPPDFTFVYESVLGDI